MWLILRLKMSGFSHQGFLGGGGEEGGIMVFCPRLWEKNLKSTYLPPST